MRPEHTASPEARHHWRGPAIAAAAFAAALAIALPLWFLRGGDEPPTVATDVTTTVAASTTTTTTTPTTTTSAVATTTTTTTVTTTPATPGIVLASIPAEGASPTSGPLVALSAGEVWTVMSAPDPNSDGDLSLIGHLKDGAWALWRLTGADLESIRGLAVAPDGTVWAATQVGVFSFDGEEWTRRFDDLVGGVTVGQGGSVWIGGSPSLDGGWLARWDGESWERVESPVGPGGAGWAELAVLPGGDVWATVRSYGCITSPLMRYDGVTLEAVQVGDRPFRSSYVSVIEVAPNGDLWVGGFLGGDPAASVDGVRQWTEPVMLARFDGEVWTIYDWPLPNPVVDCKLPLLDIAVGPDGAVWLASWDGLASFDGTDWTTHIEGQQVGSVDVAPDGTVWYTDPEGVHTLSIP